MKKTITVGGNGIGFAGMLFLIFLTLKLCKVITWSWWFVFMPLYIVPVIILVVMLVVWLGLGILSFLDYVLKSSDKNKK